MGGTCLHQGCIPTKSFLKSAEVFQYVQHADDFGVTAEQPTFNFSKVMERKKSHRRHNVSRATRVNETS